MKFIAITRNIFGKKDDLNLKDDNVKICEQKDIISAITAALFTECSQF